MNAATATGARPRDAGSSLAELMVAVVLIGIVGTVLTATAVLTLRTSSGVDERLENTRQGELGIAAAGKALRTAVLPEQLDDLNGSECTNTGCDDGAIISASPTRITFYANMASDVGPSRVTLEVKADPDHADTGLLWQRTLPARATGDGTYDYCLDCSPQSRILARGLRFPSPAVFGFYDYEGAAMHGASITTADLPRISSIDVMLTVQQQPGSSRYPARTVLTRVRLPNIDVSRVVDAS